MILEKDIEVLNLGSMINNRLKYYNIILIKDLWELTRKDIKKLGFSDNEISQIIIKLQLYGIDLNKKIY